MPPQSGATPHLPLSRNSPITSLPLVRISYPQIVTQKAIGDKSPAIPVISENVLCHLETPLVVFCFGIFLCRADQWPDTADATQHKVLDVLRARMRRETRARGIDGKRQIHTDILISVQVVLIVELVSTTTSRSVYRHAFPLFDSGGIDLNINQLEHLFHQKGHDAFCPAYCSFSCLQV